ncbi:type II secretion system protein N [Pseudomonas indica]|uniref:Type IV pilus biogenesis n=1 Tax=Pseudomonas indica TaxID=137658 RepID=A0A1G9GPY1_9PSED|nr:type II secretion system protein N [Pseudomonas indica]SDL02688.1 Type IV pilus biogenesis [Pseudomonas indica]
MASTPFTLTTLATARFSRLAIFSVVIMAMLGSLGWQAMGFYRQLQQPFADRTPPSAPSKAEPHIAEMNKAILQLFGSTELQPGDISDTNQPLPESNLNLSVSAIFHKTKPGKSTVILKDGDKELILNPGDEARPGILVHRIDSNRITLKRNGKLEQISLKGFGEIEGLSSTAPSLPLAEVPEQSDPYASQPLEPPVPTQPASTAYQQFIQRKLAQNK